MSAAPAVTSSPERPRDLPELLARLRWVEDGVRAVRQATMSRSSRDALARIAAEVAACRHAVAVITSTRQQPKAVPARAGTATREERRQANPAWQAKNNPADGTRYCPRCRQHKPFSEFDAKNEKGTLRFCCRRCYKTYQRERYVAANKRAIIVEVSDGDEIVGAICNGCGKPFEIGQLAAGTRLFHQECLP